VPEQRGNFLGIILDSLASGVLAIDRDANIIVFNAAAARILGVPKERALGRNLLSIVPNSGLVNVLRTGAPEVGRPQSIGSLTVMTNRSPIFRDGTIIGAVSIF